MKTNYDQPKKQIVLLGDTKKTTLKKAEKTLGVQLTSSAELSSTVRAQNIYDAGNGLYLKNLGVAILDNFEINKLKASAKSNSNILYWENDRTFTTQPGLELLQEMRTDVNQLSEKVDELELFLRDKNNNDEQENITTWGVKAIGANLSSYTGDGIDICILDTGFYKDHPDFEGRTITGKSFIAGENWFKDGNGHGTHCTGSAAGYLNKSTGVRYGVAYEANIAIAKVLSDNGSGSTSNIIDAIDNAIEKGYKVLSMSLGSPVQIGETPSIIFEHIGQKAIENNCLVIAAAGNNSNRPNLPRPISSPANAKSIMAVAALNKNLKVANFSNAGINASDGGRVDISAPGVGVYSAYSKNAPGQVLYKHLNGTSMATPHAAGMAALYWEAMPNATATEIWLKLEERSKYLVNQLARDVGRGMVFS